MIAPVAPEANRGIESSGFYFYAADFFAGDKRITNTIANSRI